MKYKILTLLLIFSIFSISSVYAEDIALQEDVEIAGINPDSPLYAIDIGLERIQERFSENAKLRHANERMAEIRVMLNESKLEYAEKGIQNYNRIRERVQNQTKLMEHSEFVDNLGLKISGIASQTSKLTEEQRSEIKQLIEQHRERIRVEVEENEQEMGQEQNSNRNGGASP